LAVFFSGGYKFREREVFVHLNALAGLREV